jgi:hypothetical protein
VLGLFFGFVGVGVVLWFGFLFFFVCVVVAGVLHTHGGVCFGFLFVFGLFSVVFLGVRRVVCAAHYT